MSVNRRAVVGCMAGALLTSGAFPTLGCAQTDPRGDATSAADAVAQWIALPAASGHAAWRT